MEKFDLEKAKAGAPLCTRDGRGARILCFNRADRHNNRRIVALVEDHIWMGRHEHPECYDAEGKFFDVDASSINDLFIK